MNLADGGWHHVVAIRDTAQDKIILYVDGATADATSPNPLEAEDLTLTTAGGSDRPEPSTSAGSTRTPFYHFDGVIDEVALYDRVLSAAEITDHYNGGLGKDICDGVAPFVPFPDDTISIWQLDETGLTPGAAGGVYADAFDGNNGGNGVVNPTPVTGQVGGAQLFDSTTTTKINVPADNSFDWQADEDFSIEFWMKTDSGIPSGQPGHHRPAIRHSWRFLVGRHRHAASDGKAAFTLRDNSGAGNNIPGGGTVNLADGGWHHVVAIRDTAQDKIILYVDGATADQPARIRWRRTTDTETGRVSDRPGPSTSAGSTRTPFYHFDGLIDEVALYDRVLSPAEITAHYNAGNETPGMGVESLRPEPLADAGTDQTVQEGATNVTLNGSGSNDDPYGTIVSFLWEQVGTPAVTLSGAATQTATFTAPDVAAAGAILTFQLTVTDNDGLTDTATVNDNG